MKFEVNENDPLHDKISELWDYLSVNDLIPELIESAREAVKPELRYKITPDVLLDAMRMWLRSIENEGESTKDYTPAQALAGVEENLDAAAIGVMLQQGRGTGDSPPGFRGRG